MLLLLLLLLRRRLHLLLPLLRGSLGAAGRVESHTVGACFRLLW